MTLSCRVPTWNFCNKDEQFNGSKVSKELCRFCVSTRGGHYCALHDQQLKADKTFVYKTNACLDATAGFAVTVDEAAPVAVDPKTIIAETLKSYNKMLNDLLKQGYPRGMAETLAMKFMTGDS